jgi:predicted PhzF superfamily epimerase YddE/YHI9
MGRSGRIDVALDKSGSVWIGGATTTCILGTITA